MRHEFLLEIGTEEIPAGYIVPALDKLREELAAGLAAFGLEHGDILTAATPRRLAVCIRDLLARQPDRLEKIMGPSRKAAFDGDNNPTKAALGFVASRGCRVEDLEVVETPKGEYLMLVQEQRGEATADLLSSLLPKLIKAIPFPKSMRWGTERLTFARPIHWLLALYGGAVVPFAVGGVASGDHTRGHRFMSPESVRITDFENYLDTLREKFVIADLAERRALVVAEVEKAAQRVGGQIVPDENLVDTVANLVEFPNAVCGVFDDRFLVLPDAVLITAMREHQKYFCVIGQDSALRANFVAVNNTLVRDERVAAEGHQRVLRARLEDALFFFDDDRKSTLDERVSGLSGIVFQAGLGTMQEKTGRLVKLAGILASELDFGGMEEVERAALLAKADLLTAMVNEFPTLQGVMGRDYALLNGESMEVATALQEHYLPLRAGGDLPTTTVGALVGIADRIDTIAGCFGIGRLPSGTADPYGLRRLALGALHILEDRRWSFSLVAFVEKALALYGDKLTEEPGDAARGVVEFIKGRFVNDLTGSGLPSDVVEAATAVSFDDVSDCRARIEALAAVREQETFVSLAATFKRVMNIIKDHRGGEVNESLFVDQAEKRLHEVLTEVEAEVAPLLTGKEYASALEKMLRMKEVVDTFFDEVMVMADDQAVRQNRLNLVAAVAGLFLKVGDVSRMQAAVA